MGNEIVIGREIIQRDLESFRDAGALVSFGVTETLRRYIYRRITTYYTPASPGLS
jgi:hypothetical protein